MKVCIIKHVLIFYLEGSSLLDIRHENDSCMLKICCTQLNMEFSNEKYNQNQAQEEL